MKNYKINQIIDFYIHLFFSILIALFGELFIYFYIKLNK